MGNLTEAPGWSGPIPTHWRWAKLNQVAQLGTGHTPDRTKPEYWENCTIPWVTAADLSHRSSAFEPLTETQQHISELGLANSAAVLHPPETVMFCRTASVGLFCRIGRPMATTQAFVTWTPGPELDSRFLIYVIAAMRPEFDRLAYGSTHLTIYMPDLEALRIPLPPVEEQRGIADFLDDQVARIDEAISIKSKQVREQSRKHRGLLPQMARKVGFDVPGPIPWFVAGAADWRILPLKAVARCLDGKRVPLSSEERAMRSGPYPYYGASTIVDYIDEFLFDGDFALVGEDGASLENEDFDVVQPVSGRVWVNNHAHVLEAVGIDRLFLVHYLRSVDRQVLISGATRPKITQDDLMHLPVPIPSRSIQSELVDLCERALNEYGHIRNSIERSISLLEERKRAVITAAVTGELDVTTARPIGVGKWESNVGARVEGSDAAQVQKPSNGGTE